MQECHKILADDADVHGNREIRIHFGEGLAVFFNVVVECCRSACLEPARRCFECDVVAINILLKTKRFRSPVRSSCWKAQRSGRTDRRKGILSP